MDASSFQFTLSVPRDPQFVATIRGLAVHAARYASCDEADAERFGGSVERAVRACLGEAPQGRAISVVVRRESGPLEVLVDGRAVIVQP